MQKQIVFFKIANESEGVFAFHAKHFTPDTLYNRQKNSSPIYSYKIHE